MPSHESAERRHGILADWNDDRGFGFVEPALGGPRVFVHISAFPRSHRPVKGCEVSYVESRDAKGRAQADLVRYATAPSRRRPRLVQMPVALAVVGSFFALLAVLVSLDLMPVTLLAASGVLSILTFGVYGNDKSAAEHGRWRTPESTLHLLAVTGGWPGALIAQRFFRHKTKKQPFRTIFWFTVIAHVVAVAWFFTEAPVPLP